MGRDETGQRAGVLTPHDGGVDLGRAPAADVLVQRNDGVRRRVDGLDHREVSVEQLVCRDLFGTDQSSLFGGGELDEVAHGPHVRGGQSRREPGENFLLVVDVRVAADVHDHPLDGSTLEG